VVSGEPGAGACSRRALIGRSGFVAAGAGVALAGCGRSSRPHVHKIPARARAADVDVLNGLLDLELRAVAAYTAGIPLLTSHVQTAAKQFLTQELTHVNELRGLIRQAKGFANKPKPSYDFGRPSGHHDVVDLLHSVEQAQISAYLEAVPVVAPGPVRAALAAILANDAQHVVVIRRALRVEPIPSAFVTGSE
jgi:Ferritin-like domain